MGELLKSIEVGGRVRQIKPIERRLIRPDAFYTMLGALEMPGGLIIGEGDSGKTTFVKMLKKAAEARGPVSLVFLRKRSCSFAVPETPKGKVATVILDGLDEYPECARDILDFVEDVDQRTCRVWVTSRPCDAASCLEGCPLFSRPLRLNPLTPYDISELALGLAVDPVEFERAAEESHLSSFLVKPGGVILLLDLFVRGRLHGQSSGETMEEIIRQFVRESRDGHTKRADEETDDPRELVAAARWIAAYLSLAGRKSIWCGDETGCPNDAVRFNDIPLREHSKALFSRVLGRRIFEPLGTDHLRFAYSDTQEYLAGTWIAERLTLDQVRSVVPADASLVNSATVRMLAWAGTRRPEFCLPWIANLPEKFFSCHAAISQFGCERYFKLLVLRATDRGQVNFDSYWHDHVFELDGFEELADASRSVLENQASTPQEASVAAFLLRGCRSDRVRSAEAIVTRILVGDLGGKDLHWTVRSLSVVCCDERPPLLAKLKRFLRAKVATQDEESVKGHLLHLLWPKFLSKAELKKLITPRLKEDWYNSYLTFLTSELGDDFGLDWLRRLQAVKDTIRHLQPMSRTNTFRATPGNDGELHVVMGEARRSRAASNERPALRLTPRQIDALCGPGDEDWRKWPKREPRFRCDVDGNFANVADIKHTRNNGYPRIELYAKMPQATQKAIKLLIAAAARKSPDDWWIESKIEGKSFSGAFQKSSPAAHRFWRDQIEVGKDQNHKGKWRILPDKLFDEHYQKNYPRRDPLLGS